MRSRKMYAKIQGLVGSLFLVAGFIFLFTAFFSVSAAFADPVEQTSVTITTTQSPRSRIASSARVSGAVRLQTNSAGVNAASSNARPAGQPQTASTKQVSTARTAAPTVSRGVVARQASATTRTAAIAERSVRSRSRASITTMDSSSRAVVARTAVQAGTQQAQARVGVTGSVIRASTSSTTSSLTTKLTAATFSNLIDPTTGMIAADAFSNCVESYYACMDEICSARSPGQRRCACAGRIKTFNDVEATLQTAKEDLLKVSGELSLLIATKGESIESAFQLTDAEKSLNCVSYRDAKKALKSGETMDSWCTSHLMLDTTTCESSMNTTCNNLYGKGTGDAWMDILNGSDSDILTSLETYASTVDEVNTFSTTSDSNLLSSYNNVDLIVNGSTSVASDSTSVDTLAQTWGYALFQYAHNNVCGRVLDSCFNGIYEMCGNRPSEQGGGTGPYNQNSDITVSGDQIEFVTPKGNSTNVGTASCFGYTSTSGDPYATVRRPVADARLSVLQKYVLDANADCDTYGEELKTQAQNMAYQKIAATQLLQKKRLEFAQDKDTAATTALSTAKDKFNSCVTEIYDCYEQQTRVNTTWSVARIKNYCAQSSEIPSCYEDMVCDQGAKKVLDIADNATNCANAATIDDNTCRNIITLAEVLNGTGSGAISNPSASTGDSKAFREYCLEHTPGIYGDGSIRDFGTGWGPGM